MSSEIATRKVQLSEALKLRLMGARVTVVSGRDAGHVCEVGPAGLIVGSGSSSDLCLEDPRVSRRHVELRREEHGLRVTDLGSTNGTLLGSTLVRDVLLVEDASLKIGDTTVAIHLSRGAPDLALSARRVFGGAVADSPAMRHVFDLLEKAAPSEVTVLLEGESGTGKDVLAQALHAESKRRDGPFVVVDCGAIPEHLVESELFGHERGAFTGAQSQRKGAFESANGGTVFLDEVGELPLDAQPKLLRALESRSFRRVGGSDTIRVDVRVVAATNRKLREAVRRREFREDLFYRLAVVHVAVPRLADRPEDVLPLAESFLRRITGDAAATVPAELARLLQAYKWPGNARELRNVVERFATFDRAEESLLFEGGERRSALPGMPFGGLENLPYHEGKQRVMDDFHRAVLPRVVERCGGSMAKAAEELGLPRQSLYRMMQRLQSGDEGG